MDSAQLIPKINLERANGEFHETKLLTNGANEEFALENI